MEKNIIKINKKYYIEQRGNGSTVLNNLYDADGRVVKESGNVHSFINYIKGVVRVTKNTEKNLIDFAQKNSKI